MGSNHFHSIPIGEDGVTYLVAWLNRWRIPIGVVVLGACIIEGIIDREPPFNLLKPGPLVIGSFILIAVGVAIRIVALGTIDKNRTLTTGGIYSLCRHPLYAGSTLLYLGFALLMNDPEFIYLGVPYLIIFFGAAAFSEEHFLSRKFGEEFEIYRRAVPGFVPLGRWRAGEFSFKRAMRRGGLQLLIVLPILLIVIQWMAVEYAH